MYKMCMFAYNLLSFIFFVQNEHFNWIYKFIIYLFLYFKYTFYEVLNEKMFVLFLYNIHNILYYLILNVKNI